MSNLSALPLLLSEFGEDLPPETEAILVRTVGPDWRTEIVSWTPRQADIYLAAVRGVEACGRERWCPFEPTSKQAEFLASGNQEILYGGGTGGGKTVALGMWALEGVDIPGYSCLLLRRTSEDLKKAGCIMPAMMEWLAGSGASWHGTDKRWTFPSGAVIEFGHLRNGVKDALRYGSASYHRIGFEELGEFESEEWYTLLFSRVGRRRLPPRADGVAVLPQVVGTCNPIGPGLGWIKARFVRPPEGETIPESRKFVPSLLDDNPHADKDQYEKFMDQLSPVTYARLRGGDWDVTPEGLVYPELAGAVGDWPKRDDRATIHIGGDWGFSDPAVVLVGQWDRTTPIHVLTITQCFYKSGVLIESVIAETRRMLKVETVLRPASGFCDPSRPDLIAEFNKAGIGVVGSENEILPGIELVARMLREGRLRIQRRASAMLVKEAGGYLWGKDEKPKAATGDHALDALRYLVMGVAGGSDTAKLLASMRPGTVFGG